MQTITQQQYNTLHSIVAEARQTLDGDSPIQHISLHQDEDTAYLDVETWRTHSAKDEDTMHRAVLNIEKQSVSKGIPCAIYLYAGNSTDGNIHSCSFSIKP